MKKNKIFKCFLSVFIVAELVLSVLIHKASPAYLYSYISIVLAVMFCLTAYEPTPRWALTQIALVFTLCADLFLVVLGSHLTLAMCFFSVTQLSYASRIALLQEKKERRAHLITRASAVLFALALTAIVLGKNTDALALVSLFYFANLIINAIFATVKIKKEPLFAIGLWLFVLCDIFVGFGMLGSYLPLAKNPVLDFLASPPINMAWVFYLPSQVLLSISTVKLGKINS